MYRGIESQNMERGPSYKDDALGFHNICVTDAIKVGPFRVSEGNLICVRIIVTYTLCGILIYECISVSLVPTSASAYPNVFQIDLWKYNLYKLHQRLSIGEYRIAVTKLGDAHLKFSSNPTCISWLETQVA